MRLLHRSSMVMLPLVLLGLTAGILSCAPVQTGPRVWLDFPLDGSEFFPDTAVSVTCHAFAREGVAEVQLAVNGEPYRLAAPAQPGEQFVEISTEWLATEPGQYVLSVIAFDMTGAATNPDRVTVTVVGESPRLMLSPTAIGTPLPSTETPEGPAATAAPSETPREPTATLPPAATPRPATATPPPPTPTSPPPPPRIVSLEANPRSIEVGECSTVRWAVEGVISAVWFDGEGVGDHDTRERCPETTTTYTLRAEGPGGEDTATVRVDVTAPPSPTPTPDTQGPAAPSVVSPTGNQGVGCGDVILDWRRASDPSGIGTYYVKVEKITGSPKSGGWSTTDTQYTVSAAWLECGQTYQWAVAAEDALGNLGPWSAWAAFTVEIT